ncbi:MAG: molybdopterin cofactor-binding domain-containing protein [Chloroflexota bacterium]
MRRPAANPSRRTFLKTTGGLVVGFSLLGEAPAATAATGQQGALGLADATRQAAPAPMPLDSWIRVNADGTVTVFSGKVELGTGVRTALAQIAAEELDVSFERVTMLQGDTAATPDEGYTAGSKTIQNGGPNVRRAAAEARAALVELAAVKLGVAADALSVSAGVISGPGGSAASYADLVGGAAFNRTVSAQVKVKAPSDYRVVGQSIARADLPGKILGGQSYVSDLRLPGMLHGRMIRPGGVGATLASIDESSIADVPGVVQVVRSGSFVGVVAEREEQAIQAATKLKVQWTLANGLPRQAELHAWMRQQPTDDKVVTSTGNVDQALEAAPGYLQATYTHPYALHGSIGPSCAVADVQGDRATVYSSTQGVFPLRGALAQLLGLAPENVRVIHVEGSGCYGHNGFDDVAGDAALLSRAVGRPVRVIWSREDEHAWEPKGPAMVMEIRGATDDQARVSAWDYHVWTPTHSTRPGQQAGNLLAGQHMDPPAPTARNGNGGGDRNAPTNYVFENSRVTAHWLNVSPLRPSALRSLGAVANSFANESFIDELAYATAQDPVDFRLRHLSDPRALAVVKAAAERFGWTARTAPSRGGTGVGFAFARYENVNAYAAGAVEVSVNASGRVRVNRVVIAHECGLIINPDGLRNQIEGNVIQGISRALFEEVTFDQSRVRSTDWRSYPILKFSDVPTLDVVLLDRPDQPAVGAGEPTVLVLPPAIANAVFDATGARVRDMPFRTERVRGAMAQA